MVSINTFMDSLTFYREASKVGPLFVLQKTGGSLQLPDLTHTSWKILERANVLEHVDFELMYLLATIEQRHQQVNILQVKIYDQVVNGAQVKPADYNGAKMTFLITLANYKSTLEDILRSYQKFEKLRKKVK